MINFCYEAIHKKCLFEIAAWGSLENISLHKKVLHFLLIKLYQHGGGEEVISMSREAIWNKQLFYFGLIKITLPTTSLAFLILTFNFRYVSGEEGSQWEESWWTNLQILPVELKRFQVAASAGQSLLDSASVIMRCGHMSVMWYSLPYKGILSPQLW